MLPCLAVQLLAVRDPGPPAEIRGATIAPLNPSADLHGCNTTAGLVWRDYACVPAEVAGAPPELHLLPPEFKFGAATASYQVEGGAFEGGRGPSIWDDFSHTPGRTANGDTGDVATDHYHRYAEDAALVKALGIQDYRMSIAWPRVMPDGYTLNPEGVAFYHRVLDALQAAGVEVMVTLYHWDLPSALGDQGGWLNESLMVPAFERYAVAMFREFGHRVSTWVTFNEPFSFVFMGYSFGTNAPGRCSDRRRCPAGNSTHEPYVAAGTVLRAHARAVAALRADQRAGRSCAGCRVGMVNCIRWAHAWDQSGAESADWVAAQRAMEVELALWTDPLYFGDYPAPFAPHVEDGRLKAFTAEESALLRGSVDFFGLNYYTSRWVRHAGPEEDPGGSLAYAPDDAVWPAVSFQERPGGGRAIGAHAESPWLYAAAGGMRNTLMWITRRYGPGTPVVVTESGCSVPGEDSLPLPAALDDQWRLSFLYEYLQAAAQAMLVDGANIKGYFVWSLLDNYEWADGYAKRFGLVRVDYGRDQVRLPKASFHWYASVIQEMNSRRKAMDRREGPPPLLAGARWRRGRSAEPWAAAVVFAATTAVGAAVGFGWGRKLGRAKAADSLEAGLLASSAEVGSRAELLGTDPQPGGSRPA